jgi:hypothetical protein
LIIVFRRAAASIRAASWQLGHDPSAARQVAQTGLLQPEHRAIDGTA